MALTQQKRPVEGVLGSPRGVPVGPRFFKSLMKFEVSEESWGVLGRAFGVQGSGGVRGGVGRSQGGFGGVLEGPLETFIFFLFQMWFCQLSNEILMVSICDKVVIYRVWMVFVYNAYRYAYIYICIHRREISWLTLPKSWLQRRCALPSMSPKRRVSQLRSMPRLKHFWRSSRPRLYVHICIQICI